jgi:hypothetical protein
MKTVATSLLIWSAIAVVAFAMSRPVPQPPSGALQPSSLRSAWLERDPVTSPPALERHFGRDTLLYFPMESRPNLPVAVTIGALSR